MRWLLSFAVVQCSVCGVVCNMAAVMLRKLHVRLLTKATWSEYIIFIC